MISPISLLPVINWIPLLISGDIRNSFISIRLRRSKEFIISFNWYVSSTPYDFGFKGSNLGRK
ncbi:hypothetical protein SADUNF_Sadunf05G0110100 [Salix dunnii]|uniref:Uncharacterized protein n=1 Tax=Salix dunnii TaxID=1413687 RepID=A0A835K7V0_9ROSI|nr:hypothetical protein SADUNF_Sadunf05G0110100 [Salix dunnii]